VWSCAKRAARQRRQLMPAAGVMPPPDEDSDNLRLRFRLPVPYRLEVIWSRLLADADSLGAVGYPW
jgi:hypothetical protein